MKFLRIQYVVSRTVREPHKRKRVEIRGGVLYLKGTWSDEATQTKIRNRIKERNPGWQVASYTPKRGKFSYDPESGITVTTVTGHMRGYGFRQTIPKRQHSKFVPCSS